MLADENLEEKHLALAFEGLELLGKDAQRQKKNKEAKDKNEKIVIDIPFNQSLNDIDMSEVIKHSQYNPNASDPEHVLLGRYFHI